MANKKPILFELEKISNQTYSYFNSITDDRLRLEILIVYFKKIFEFNRNLIKSFVIQYAPLYFSCAERAALEHISPERLIEILNILANLNTYIDYDRNKIKNSATKVLFDLSKIYFYLGEMEKGLRCLILRKEILNSENITPLEYVEKLNDYLEKKLLFSEELENIIKKAINNSSKSVESNYEMFLNFRESFSLITKQFESEIDEIYEEWREIEEGESENQINCLLIEKLNLPEISSYPRSEKLNSYGKLIFSEGGQNVVRFYNVSPSLKNELELIVSDSVVVGEKIYKKIKKKNPTPLSISYSFLNKSFMYTGKSLSAGAALLALNNFLILNNEKNYYRFKFNSAVSGELDQEGNFERFPEGTLKLKIEGAFFSNLRCIVLPFENNFQALSYLFSLQSRYPMRKLELIFVKNLFDILRNKKIIKIKSSKWIKYFLSKSSIGLRFGAILIFLSFILLTWIFLSNNPQYHFWKNRKPKEIEVKGNNLKVLNIYNQTLWKKEFEVDLEEGRYSGAEKHLPLFIDLNGDRKKELLFPLFTKTQEHITSFIVCLNNSGKELWRYFPGRKGLRTQNEEFSFHYMINSIKVIERKNGEKNIILVSTQSPWYPCQISFLNIDGKLIGEYWNSGHVGSEKTFLVEDLDGDGEKEIILGGQNNGYKRAVLVVLDVRKIKGASPQDQASRYKFLGMDRGKEKYYLLFPRSSLNKSFRVRNKVESISLIRENKEIEVVVDEYTGEGINCCLHYYFDFNFRLKKIQFSDHFMSKMIELKSYEIIEDFTDELENYKYNLEYWDGERWTKIPSMNKYWLGK
ncbi:MAG: hypothetical protein AB1410_01555 [Acidobacteriota bacterium]